jgi:AcrR family transcriptional regulator
MNEPEGRPAKKPAESAAGSHRPRALRADARRNRAKVLEVARTVFASDGLAVPIDEIARRAGVGAGTVYRHFPTKEALFEAIVIDRIAYLVDQGTAMRTADDPGVAFFTLFTAIIEEGMKNKALFDAIADTGVDLEAATSKAGRDLERVIGELLRRAQRAGAVRGDVRAADVKALIVGCLAMDRSAGDARSQRRSMAIVYDGLRVRGGNM